MIKKTSQFDVQDELQTLWPFLTSWLRLHIEHAYTHDEEMVTIW